MNMYKKALLENLMFRTPRGKMTVCGVAGLNKVDWNAMAVAVYNTQAEAGKSFLKNTVNDESQQLRLEILKDLIKNEEKAEAKAAEQAGVREELSEYTDILANKQRKDKLKQSTKDIRENIERLQGKLDV